MQRYIKWCGHIFSVVFSLGVGVVMGIYKMKAEISVALILIIAILAGVGSVWFLKHDDGVVEEFSEGVIENQLKLPNGTVDLTPSSPE